MVMEEKDDQEHKTILKKQKSLPYTNRDKLKNVHFADCCGLSLVSVHKISMDDLTIQNTRSVANEVVRHELLITFPQPVSCSNYNERLDRLNVSLENVIVSNHTVMGTIKVKNITYHKSVFVRYTIDGWKNFVDIMASYVQDSCDGIYDRFSFGITIPNLLKDGAKLEFAICFRISCPNEEYWDNNDGNNYLIECKDRCVSRNASFSALWSHLIPSYKK